MELFEYQEAGRQLVQKLRLYTDPVAIKYIKDASELPGHAIRPSATGQYLTLCQAFYYARRHQKHIGITGDDNCCFATTVALGMEPVEDDVVFLESQLIQGWHKDQEAEMVRIQATYNRIGLENLERMKQIKGFYCAPLAETTAIPDSILIYGMPVQITTIIHSLAWEYKYTPTSSFEGFGESCVKGGLVPFLTGKPQVVIPGMGCLLFSGANEAEVGIGMPGDLVFYVLENLFKTGASSGQNPGLPFKVGIPNYTPDVSPGFAFLRDKVQEYKNK